MRVVDNQFLKKEFWIHNTDFYKSPYLRLEKCARIVNSIAHGKECTLLDIGCGPATLAKLLGKNIHYYGIDIAIHQPAPNLIEMNIVDHEVKFGNQKFDLIVAAGLFEYLGRYQQKKLSEIRNILKEGGKFITTYTNFSHIHPPLQEPTYNNVMSIQEFTKEVELFFKVDRFFPASHNWIRQEPRRKWLKRINMGINFSIPLISSRLANNYFFICSPK